MKVIHPLKPIYNKKSQVLILGSMPSVKSREESFYYAHPSNRFWQILENLFNTNLNTREDKIKFLLNNKIALWDVFREVDIIASSDASIKNVKLNDINLLIKSSNIKAIFCTGKTAYNNLTKKFNTNLPVFYLPSPSSANASISLETLIEKYRIILKYLKN